MAETSGFATSPLPRLWVAKATPLAVGETLRRSDGLLAAAAAAALTPGHFPGGVRSVATSGGDITLLTPSGLQVRLGDVGELRLKLAIAERIVSYVGAPISSDAYLDVSVPERPVLGSQSALAGQNAQLAQSAASTQGTASTAGTASSPGTASSAPTNVAAQNSQSAGTTPVSPTAPTSTQSTPNSQVASTG
jgi:hypothetical protein